MDEVHPQLSQGICPSTYLHVLVRTTCTTLNLTNNRPFSRAVRRVLGHANTDINPAPSPTITTTTTTIGAAATTTTSSTLAMLHLHVWGSAFSLPSIDPECLAAIAYFSEVVPHGEWTLTASNDVSLTPKGTLPQPPARRP